MSENFADTGYWIALIDRREQGRGRDLQVSKEKAYIELGKALLEVNPVAQRLKPKIACR